MDEIREEVAILGGKIMKLYRVGEVAEMFDVHPNTIRKWVKTGILNSIKLPGSRYNRFTVDEINRLRREMKLPTLEQEK
jgi:excisionase family DNA binding protein